MAHLLQWRSQTKQFQPEGLCHETTPIVCPAQPLTIELGVFIHAEQCAVTELLEIARTVLTLDIAFESRTSESAAVPDLQKTAGRLNVPVVLRNGQVYGTLWCADADGRTAMGSRAADALRTVAVLVGHEVDRHRRTFS